MGDLMLANGLELQLPAQYRRHFGDIKVLGFGGRQNR
jgi:hypothetical protein